MKKDMSRKDQLALAYHAGKGLRTPTPATIAGRLLFETHKGDVARAIADARLILAHLERVEEDEQRVEFEKMCERVDAVNESAVELLQRPYLRLVRP